jgi:hypothetical protein
MRMTLMMPMTTFSAQYNISTSNTAQSSQMTPANGREFATINAMIDMLFFMRSLCGEV